MTSTDDAPAAFAGRRLFEPVANLLARFGAPGVPDAERLTRVAEERGARTAAGAAIRFVVPGPLRAPYEDRVFERGEVPTRPGDWHDFFNALAWCVWPRAKAACNRLHVVERHASAAAGGVARGAKRDALTQFDECGVVVVSIDPAIPALLADHRWEDAFLHRRERLVATTRFLVFGHGTWDQLRRPFVGLCAKAIYRVVEPQWLALDDDARQAETDLWLARHLADRITRPRDLAPLPLLGIPGVTPESESPDYYRDAGQFRPRRR